MPTWPKDTDFTAKIKLFGDPRTAGFEDHYLINIIPPFQMYYDKHPIKTIRVNKVIAPALQAVFSDVFLQCGHDQTKIDNLGLSNYGGCYNFRSIRGSNNLSNHALAIAIDIDPDRNPLGAKIGAMSPIVVDAFKKQGAKWGGNYKSRADWMHFEFVS